ncbi:unnamed protein product [Clonostachys rosea f. rosea IK726]|uniref:Uncharacterized protein n=2 Tax=Bionectria ochroleuca TaxID=29856 RepID=A0A0B7JPX8_BIOOC|nr:unnamed protein product [Clonostachys rosea f. rosea IK726]
MRGRSVEKLVYEFIFPKAKANDPQNFQALLTRNLIPEVRQETQAFYGHLDTQEAKYPGLDYTHKTHRIRLRRWPWHTKLFRAWEGTKWAKEKFESEQGITIRDTTADDIPEWDDEQDGIVKSYGLRQPRVLGDEEDDETSPDEDEEEQSDDELESEWEQWFKNALESGLIHDDMTEQAFRQLLESTVVPTGLIPVNMVSAARAGQWSEIPERLQPILRRSLRSETASAAAQEYRSSRIRASWSPATTRLSGLRLPTVGESTSSRRSAGAPGALRS